MISAKDMAPKATTVRPMTREVTPGFWGGAEEQPQPNRKEKSIDQPFYPRVTTMIPVRMARDTSQINKETVEDSRAFSVVSQVRGLIPL